MGTRSIIVFKDEYNETHTYMHWDGYPSNRLEELQKFLKWNKPRNDDLSYATANFIFWHKLESLKNHNRYEDNKSKQITTIEDMLKIHEEETDMHTSIGVVDSKSNDFAYKYVVDLDKETIHIDGSETDVTVAFGQVVRYDDQDNIVQEEKPIPA